jgi:hypothetical protein
MPDTQERMKHTVLSFDAAEFRLSAQGAGYCFRCELPLDRNSDGWAALARVDRKVDQVFLVGGALCAACVADWNQWKRGPTNR